MHARHVRLLGAGTTIVSMFLAPTVPSLAVEGVTPAPLHASFFPGLGVTPAIQDVRVGFVNDRMAGRFHCFTTTGDTQINMFHTSVSGSFRGTSTTPETALSGAGTITGHLDLRGMLESERTGSISVYKTPGDVWLSDLSGTYERTGTKLHIQVTDPEVEITFPFDPTLVCNSAVVLDIELVGAVTDADPFGGIWQITGPAVLRYGDPSPSPSVSPSVSPSPSASASPSASPSPNPSPSPSKDKDKDK